MGKPSTSQRGQRPTNSGEKPKPATNRVVNHHRRLPQYPRSVGKGDVDVVFGVNINTPLANRMSERSESPATTRPTPSTGSVSTSSNKYRRNTD